MKCEYCGNKFVGDSRGRCASCGGAEPEKEVRFDRAASPLVGFDVLKYQEYLKNGGDPWETRRACRELFDQIVDDPAGIFPYQYWLSKARSVFAGTPSDDIGKTWRVK